MYTPDLRLRIYDAHLTFRSLPGGGVIGSLGTLAILSAAHLLSETAEVLH